MDANEPVVIQTTNNLGEAEILKGVLESEGIQCELEGENQGSFAGILAVKILVRSRDEEKARQVLASHVHHQDQLGEGQESSNPEDIDA
jgi:putative signal transducing protein